MTTYILAGGNDRAGDAYGRALANEVYKIKAGPLHIMSCFYSVEEDMWPDCIKVYEVWFRRYFGADISYDYTRLNQFDRQAAKADVIYLHGGENDLLCSRLSAYSNLQQLLAGKVIIGSSAGANCLSEWYWSRSKQAVTEGLHVVPVSVMVHYGKDEANGPKTAWEQAKRLVRQQGQIEPLLLHEGEFEVITL